MRRIGGAMAMVALLATGALAQALAQVPALTLTATSVGCHWRYTYAGPGGVTTVFDAGRTPCTHSAYCPLGLDPDRAAAVPIGAPVRLVATSADTLRVLALPSLHLQVDALPGKVSATTLTIEAEGLYPGRQGADCAGDSTAIAPALRAITPAAFDDWLKEKRHGR